MKYRLAKFFNIKNNLAIIGSTLNNSFNKYCDYAVLKQSENNFQINLKAGGGGECSSEEDFNLSSSKMSSSYNLRQEFEKSYEELIDTKHKTKRMKIGIISGAIVLLIVLVIIAVVLLTNTNIPGVNESLGNSLYLEDILRGRLIPIRFNGTWSSGNEILYKNELGAIRSFNVSSQKRSVISAGSFEVFEAFYFEKSPDGKYLLIARNFAKLYRYSFLAIYECIDIQTGIIIPIRINGKQEPLMLAKWSSTGNALILIYHSNLYYKPTVNETEIQLTYNTNPSILNGHPDWVYEEEIFSSNIAVWFNPAGNKIVYIQFDDSSTYPMNLPFYGIPGSLDYQYPQYKIIPYPKAGSPNPFVKLNQIVLSDAIANRESHLEIPVPNPLNTEEHLITAVTWLNNDQILSVWMNRIQNRAYIQVSNETHRYEIYKIESTTGWVDLYKPPIKNEDGSKIALISPQKQENNQSYRHLIILSTKNTIRNTPIPLTKGEYVINDILKWDYKTNIIFYTANEPKRTHILHLYAIKAEKGEIPQCLSCNIVFEDIPQNYFSFEFSPFGNYLVITSLGPSIPRIDIYEWIYEKPIRLKHIIEWETNQEIRLFLSQKQLPQREYHTIQVEDNITVNVLLLLPPGINKKVRKKYPLLIDVYGGPDSNAVVDKWNIDWGSYLASNLSVIYAKIDGRGSGLRSEEYLHSIYKKLGSYEIYDQINVTKKLQQKFHFIDPKKTGIWGWSYGGYASAMALAMDDVYECAASIAPVTDWAYYDSIYTERYMTLPINNPTGYSSSRLTSLASKFKGKKYLLVHGTFDDNVHYQQSMMLARNLERHDILFKQISYPDEDHGLSGVKPHLFHSLNQFFGDCFNLHNIETTKK